MKIDLALIEKYVSDDLIIVNKHPEHNLLILNYSRKTQFEKLWDSFTLSCRGLIVDTDGNIIARPFSKFFNYEEHKPEEIPNTNFEVFDKMDGSLGILFFYNGKYELATKGSFVSEQAIRGKEILKKYDLSVLDNRYTHLFEIIYPENRIVCKYNDEKMVLLGVIKTDDGTELNYSEIEKLYGGRFDIVKKYNGIYDINELKARNIPNEEGYVLKYENGFRIKVKFEEYCRLHAIITNISTYDIWEHLRDGKDINVLLDNVPDEFDTWVRKNIEILMKKYSSIEEECNNIFSKVYYEGISKKEFALNVIKETYSSILFKMFDKKPYVDNIWKSIKPEYSKPYYKEEKENENIKELVWNKIMGR